MSSEIVSRGSLIVVSAPSGAGKSSLVDRVVTRVSRLRYSVSWTTRAARKQETEGIHYRYVSLAEFTAMRDTGGFLEWAEVHGNLYGTPREPVEATLSEGWDLILDIDIQGAAQVRRQMPEAVTVFIMPPDRQVLEARLRSRDQNSPADIERRLRNATIEIKSAAGFDYVIVNHDLDQAAGALEAIILAERQRYDRMKQVAQEIVETFGGESFHA
jgi:guanylate kinase